MFNQAINKLASPPKAAPVSTPVEPTTSLSEQDFIEPEPEGKEEVFLNALPPKPVDVKVWSSHIKNPG